LADDDHFEFLERALVEGAEDVAAARIDALCGVFVANEVDELREVGFLEFGGQSGAIFTFIVARIFRKSNKKDCIIR